MFDLTCHLVSTACVFMHACISVQVCKCPFVRVNITAISHKIFILVLIIIVVVFTATTTTIV